MFKNLTQFMADPISFMKTCSENGHEISRHRLGPKNFVFVFNPEAAQEILVKRPQVYVQNRTIFDRIKPVTGDKGLVQLSGSDSQKARAKARPMFVSNAMEEARGYIEAYTNDLLNKLGASSTINVTETMTDLILRTALRIFIGIDSEDMVASIGPKFLRLNHLCGMRMRSLLPLPLVIPSGTNLEIIKLRKDIRNLLKIHLARNYTNGISTVPAVFRDDSAVVDHCMTFLFAGHETTAASLAFTLLLLAQNPSYQEAIHSGDAEMTLAVYKESLRLYPPAYMLARQAVRADELQAGGPDHSFKIKKSDQVFIAIASMHRSARFFESPNDFIPERFLSKLKHPFAFLPFGAGGKSCVGERLAYLEATVILKMICQKYQIKPVAETILSEPLITLHPVSHQQIRLELR